MEHVEEVTTSFYFYLIKSADITYVTVLYFIFGYYIAKTSDLICDTLFGTDYTQLNRFELILTIIIQILISLILSVNCKKIIDKIPFPLEGLYGYSHFKLKDLIYNGGILWSLGLLIYQKSLIKKINLLKKYFNK